MQSDLEDGELCLSFSKRQRTLSKATLATPLSMAKESTATFSTRRREARKATNATHVVADNHTVAEYLTADVSNQLEQVEIDNEDNLHVDSINHIIDTAAASNDLHADCGYAERTAEYLIANASNKLEPLRTL